ncbi:putative vomeronasal receptor-like protein 4 [Nannospalax galili]|uniref:Vomeronasal type-1 receptor n=1 Tax=Nannospalax galili TaxID=1026970 RepID=A0A4Y1N6Z2_NANGA|nr:putative vomeronasal receptor-like protein 4 [Nannospalax galili]AWV50377.1 vomeronasal type 1 receptor 22 [Nannospalax galili]AWV50378.1 vomeronasal type 1 receptor 22 [Nannospalax galili]AWV50379.1 vomeronasal type 1 receptor 22 [Nannospalax galili]AWV50380.1 vomeronasal type 1 receptor 22 [Nannospalax galili]AWV50381.1 vomeronasal type 1 receptor 22 [Nannospalax galili]
MIWGDLIQKMILFYLTGSGILANVLIFVRHVRTLVVGPERKPMDLILIHLTFSNTIIICHTGIIIVAAVFSFREFRGDFGCKTVVYLSRMARGLSICTTCLLSMVQAVTINPRTTLWTKLKPQTTRQVLPHLLLFWVFNSLISSNLLHYITAGSSVNMSRVGMYAGYCYMVPPRLTVRLLFLSLMTIRDAIFQTLMGWSSGSMALHLYKHHKRVLYLHSSRFANKSSPEIRAAQSTLILMACFLCFYWADFIFSFYMGSTLTYDSSTLNIKILLELGYASTSPFILISRGIHAAKPLCAH